jgi:predicted DNA-binding transcriptional regulator AlpA
MQPDRPTHRLMGAAEIGRRLGGVSRERVYQITQRRNFPEPYQKLSMGFVWLEVDVEAWIAEHRPELAEEPEGSQPD